jgi:protein-glutamine gamma-glutamyltransferase
VAGLTAGAANDASRSPSGGGAGAGPGPALGALAVAVAAAALATGELNIGAVALPGAAVAVLFAAGTVLSAARWRPPPAESVPTPANLAVAVIVTLVVVFTRATVDAGDPPGGLHALGEVFLVVLLIRSVALIDANRIRSAVLVSLGAVLGAVAEHPLGDDVAWLLLWLVAALATLAAAGELAGSRLSCTGRARPRWGRRRRETLLIGAVAVLAALAVVVVDPDPGRGRTRYGDTPEARRIAPYVAVVPDLDTGVRGDPGNAVVLRIRASAPDFWRAQTFDAWDGRVWHRTGLTVSTFPEAGAGSVSPGVGDVEGGGTTFVQHVTVEAPFFTALVGAYRIDQVDSPVPAVLVHGDGTVELGQPLGRGSEYTVISLRQPVTPDLLRDPSHDPLTQGIPPFIADTYLPLPVTPSRVSALAHQLTDGVLDTYDKVRALESWLGTNTTYTRDIPPLPDGADAVEQFLFVDRRGFCEQIASALAVMLRSVGVPARIATGFVPGSESALGGEFTSRASDAHAWVEVWFPDIGWQAFDPTASVPLAGLSQRSAAQRAADLARQLAPWLLGIGVAAAVIAGGLVTMRVLGRRTARRRRPWVVAYLERLERAGAARGRPRAAPETPSEYATALARLEPADPRLVTVGAVMTDEAYGAGGVPADDRAFADAVVADLERRSRRTRRPTR